MRDINTPLWATYYTALNGNLPHPSGSGQVKVYEGEEPDNLLSDLYVVVTGINASDTSTKNSTDVSASVQITVNSRKEKYNNRKHLNEICNLIYQVIKPTPNAVLDMDAYNIQMLNLRVQNDVEVDYGFLSGSVFISRNIIFQQDLFIRE